MKFNTGERKSGPKSGISDGSDALQVDKTRPTPEIARSQTPFSTKITR
jgi:hypothetical protein